jgi:hypothetical protein
MMERRLQLAMMGAVLLLGCVGERAQEAPQPEAVISATSTSTTSSTSSTTSTTMRPWPTLTTNAPAPVSSTTYTTTTTSTLSAFERLFLRASKKDPVTSTSLVQVNEFEKATTTSIANITGPYQNRYGGGIYGYGGRQYNHTINEDLICFEDERGCRLKT